MKKSILFIFMIFAYSGIFAQTYDTVPGERTDWEIIRGYINNNYKQILSDNRIAVGKGMQITTIQAGIDSAAKGDLIVVYPGTYTENITLKDSVNIIGLDLSDVKLTGNVTCGNVTSSLQGIYINGTITQTAGTLYIYNSKILNFSMSGGTVEAYNVDVIQDVISSAGNLKWIGDYSGRDILLSGTIDAYIRFGEKILFGATDPLELSGGAKANVHFGKSNWLGNVVTRKIMCSTKDSSELNFSCFDSQAGYRAENSSIMRIHDTYGYRGFSYVAIDDSSTVEIYNTYMLTDITDNSLGSHTLEMSWISEYLTYGYQTLKLFNSTFEFTGTNGEYSMVGNPIALYAGTFEATNCTFKISGNSQTITSGLGYRGVGATGYGCKHKFTNCTFIDEDQFDSSPTMLVKVPTVGRVEKEVSSWYSVFENCTFISILAKKSIEYESLMPDDGDGTTYLVTTDTADYEDYPSYKGPVFRGIQNESGEDIINVENMTGAGVQATLETLIPYWNDGYFYSYGNLYTGDVKHSQLTTNVGDSFDKNTTTDNNYIRKKSFGVGTPGANAAAFASTQKLVVTVNYVYPINDANRKLYTMFKANLYFGNRSKGDNYGYIKELQFYAVGEGNALTESTKLTAANFTTSEPIVTKISEDGSSMVFEVTHANGQGQKAFLEFFDNYNIESVNAEVQDK